MKISADRARTLIYEGHDPENELSVEQQEQTGTGRWVSHHQLVVMDGQGRYWATHYDEGLTENQDTEAFEDEDEAEFREVRKVPQTTYRYEPVQ